MIAAVPKPDPEYAHVWACPVFAPVSGDAGTRAERLHALIAAEDPLPSGPVGVAGLELRAALLLLQGGSRPIPPDNDFWTVKCRALLLRPAIEPIVCSYWARFPEFRIDNEAALKMASAMAGRPVVYRQGPTTGRSKAGNVGFEPFDRALQWLEKLEKAATAAEFLPALPAYCFAQTIMAHPFSDGSGRFARLMVHAALARCTGIDRPVIALAPAFYLHANRLAVALTALSGDGDWTAFHNVFLAVLGDALALTHALRDVRVSHEAVTLRREPSLPGQRLGQTSTRRSRALRR